MTVDADGKIVLPQGGVKLKPRPAVKTIRGPWRDIIYRSRTKEGPCTHVFGVEVEFRSDAYNSLTHIKPGQQVELTIKVVDK